jgi:hypothetical protein
MKNLVNGIWKGKPKEDLTEQALLLVLVALVSVTAMKGLASAVHAIYNTAPADPAITP